jgi:hypothetical protein
MKRVIGILGVIIISMLLGFSIAWARSEEVSLISDYPAAIVVSGG